MAVFYKKEWFASVFFKIFFDFVHGRIHTAVQVQIGIIVGHVIIAVSGAFVLGEPAWIKFFGPPQRFFKIASIRTFITHGPHHDTEAVLIALDHMLNTVKD